MKKIILLVALATVMVAPSAFAKVSFSLTGGISYGGLSKTEIPDDGILGASTSYKGDLGFGGGVLIDFHMSPTAAFEIGALYLSRKATSTVTPTLAPEMAVSESSSAAWIHIPALFRFKLGKSFSLGVGGYYDNLMESGITGSDYGAKGSLRVHLNRFFIDGQFNYGLKDSANANKEILGLVGYTFGGEK